LIDYVVVSGTMKRNVLEFADHLHEHFVNPCTIDENGRYNVPNDPKEGYRYVSNVVLAARVRCLTFPQR